MAKGEKEEGEGRGGRRRGKGRRDGREEMENREKEGKGQWFEQGKIGEERRGDKEEEERRGQRAYVHNQSKNGNTIKTNTRTKKYLMVER